MKLPSESDLKRKYLMKIDTNMRARVMEKMREIDGDGKPARKPRSWEEVAWCIDEELEGAADVKAPDDYIHALETRAYTQPRPAGPTGGGGSAGSVYTCTHCSRPGHFKNFCHLLHCIRFRSSLE